MRELIEEIKELIKDSNEYRASKEAELAMLSDASTLSLLNEYQSKQKEYNDALRFEKYGSDVSKVKKELADIKYRVDTNEFVVKYNDCYKKLKELLDSISANILDGIK